MCRHADCHDAKKGGIVYLLDNTPIDQQKYELTIETGFRKGAGTSAKVKMSCCNYPKNSGALVSKRNTCPSTTATFRC